MGRLPGQCPYFVNGTVLSVTYWALPFSISDNLHITSHY